MDRESGRLMVSPEIQTRIAAILSIDEADIYRTITSTRGTGYARVSMYDLDGEHLGTVVRESDGDEFEKVD